MVVTGFICSIVIDRMGGSIDLRSELGVGTTVEVRLRRAAPALARAS